MEPIIIHFEQGKSDAIPGEMHLLEPVERALRYPETTLTIEGHASKEGPPERNQQLSRERAENIRAYLIVMGATMANITTRWWGATKLKEPEVGIGTTLEGCRKKNRRVEVTFVHALQKELDALKEYYKYRIQLLRQKQANLEARKERAKALPNRSPSVLYANQAEVDEARMEREAFEAKLKKITEAEAEGKDVEEIWKVAKHKEGQHDGRIRKIDAWIDATEKRMAEAAHNMSKPGIDPKERKFWSEMVEEYQFALNDWKEALKFEKRAKKWAEQDAAAASS